MLGQQGFPFTKAEVNILILFSIREHLLLELTIGLLLPLPVAWSADT